MQTDTAMRAMTDEEVMLVAGGFGTTITVTGYAGSSFSLDFFSFPQFQDYYSDDGSSGGGGGEEAPEIVVTATAEQQRIAIDAAVVATQEADFLFFLGFGILGGAYLSTGRGALDLAKNGFDLAAIGSSVLAAHQAYINHRADELYYERIR